MQTLDDMLQTWANSAAVMHLAHHRTAGRFERLNLWLNGVLGATLTAIVGTTGFSALAASTHPWAAPATLALAGLAAVLGAVTAAVDFRGRSARHHAAAAGFQGLRREIEEDLIRLRQGHPKPCYGHLRDRWSAALAAAPRLPDAIHRSTQAQVGALEKAAAERENRPVCLEWEA